MAAKEKTNEIIVVKSAVTQRKITTQFDMVLIFAP